MPNAVSVTDRNRRTLQVPDHASLTRVLKRMQQDINTLSGRSNNMKAQGPTDMGGHPIKNSVNSASPTPGELVTYGLLQSLASPAAIRKSISMLGETQLNVQGLHGLLADPQNAIVPDPPAGLPNPQTSVEGQLGRVGGQLYVYTAATGWIPTSGMPIALTTQTSTYVAQPTDHTIICNGTFTVTLPITDLFADQEFRIKNHGGGMITVSAGGVVTLDGVTAYPLGPWMSSTIFVWDGTGFWVFGGAASI